MGAMVTTNQTSILTRNSSTRTTASASVILTKTLTQTQTSSYNMNQTAKTQTSRNIKKITLNILMGVPRWRTNPPTTRRSNEACINKSMNLEDLILMKNRRPNTEKLITDLNSPNTDLIGKFKYDCEFWTSLRSLKPLPYSIPTSLFHPDFLIPSRLPYSIPTSLFHPDLIIGSD